MSEDLPPTSGSGDDSDARAALAATASARSSVYRQVGIHTVSWWWLASLSLLAGAHVATLDLQATSNQTAAFLLPFALSCLTLWAALRIHRHVGASLRFREMPRDLQRPLIAFWMVTFTIALAAMALAWRSDLAFSFTLAGSGIALLMAAAMAVTRRHYRRAAERIQPSDELRG